MNMRQRQAVEGIAVKMRACAEDHGDVERMFYEADRLLIDLVRVLAPNVATVEGIVAVYEQMKKWYS